MDKDIRLALISIHPGLTSLFKELCKEQNIYIETIKAALHQAIDVSLSLEAKNIQAIICRCATADIIRPVVNLPVIVLEITSYDIIESLSQAKKLGRKIAFFDYIERKDKYDIYKIKDILQIPGLKIYHYRIEEDTDKRVKQLAKEGYEVVVSSKSSIIKTARDHGMHGVWINLSREAIREVITRVQEVIKIRDSDWKIKERLNTIVNHSYNGIIVVDETGKITNANEAAEIALQTPIENLLNKDVRKVKDPNLMKLYANGRLAMEDIQQIHYKQYIIRRIPLKMKEKVFGIIIAFQEIKQIQNLEATIRKKLYDKGLVAKYDFSDIIGTSGKIKETIEIARKYSKTNSTILIMGESGTGKELFAHSIHQNSLRKKGPFIVINCAAIPENLLESELFGYEEGAFTGAKRGGNPGLFEVAHGGTLFLDEILEMPIALQARLLRVLQEKVVRRVGGYKVIPVDVRILAATNKNPSVAVQEHKLREDLYFRLNVLNLKIPSLRDRPQDIPALIDYFLRNYGTYGKDIPRISSFHMKKVLSYPWPGNVRELQSFIEKYALLTGNEPNYLKVTEDLLAELLLDRPDSVMEEGDKIMVPIGTLEEMELNIINILQELYPVKQDQLAKMLGVSRATLWRKLKMINNVVKQ